MDVELIKVVGTVGGVAGLAFGVYLLIFREVIRKTIFANLTKQQSYRLLILLLVLTWSIAFGGIGAWLWATLRGPSGPLPQTTYRIIDSETKDPVYRDLELIYTNKSGGGTEPLTRHDQGQAVLPGEPEDIKIGDVHCEGYAYSGPPRQQDGWVIELDRKVGTGSGKSFLDAITPDEGAIEWVSERDAQAAVQGQVVGDPIQLTCDNRTPYFVNLVLYRWTVPDVGAPDSDLGWTAVGRPCRPKAKQTQRILDDKPGGYYYVFGSVFGLKATQVASGNLHQPPVTLVIDYDRAAHPQEPPRLTGSLVYGDAG